MAVKKALLQLSGSLWDGLNPHEQSLSHFTALSWLMLSQMICGYQLSQWISHKWKPSICRSPERTSASGQFLIQSHCWNSLSTGIAQFLLPSVCRMWIIKLIVEKAESNGVTFFNDHNLFKKSNCFSVLYEKKNSGTLNCYRISCTVNLFRS